eukprot:398466_1
MGKVNDLPFTIVHQKKKTMVHYDILDPYLRPYFWIPISKYIPKSVSPNLVTILGATSFFISISIWVYETTNLESCSSSFGYYVLALGVFIYQLCDNLDGIHARNTNQSSALGMLLDHGVDAYVNTIHYITGISPIVVYCHPAGKITFVILCITYEYIGNL